MSVNPLQIIEQQMEYLKSRSEKALLTEAETAQLATLVKVRMLIMSKNGSGDGEDLENLSTDELTQMLELLKK